MTEMKFFCGAGKEKITPPAELIPNLFGLTRTRFSQVHDELYLRVIALQYGEEKYLLISVDLDKAPCPVEFTEKLEEATGVPAEHMLYFGIHAHAVPIIGFRPFEARNDIRTKPENIQKAVHAYEAYILERLIRAAKEALDSLRPACYSFGYGKSYINRRRARSYKIRKGEKKGCVRVAEGWNMRNGEADPTVFLMKFTEPDGTPIAFLVNYAVHNVSMFLNDTGDGSMAISSDIGGTVSQFMEAEFPGTVALWSSGAAGDVNCHIASMLEYPDPVTGDQKGVSVRDLRITEAFMEMQAAEHFQDILDINEGLNEGKDCGGIAVATDYSKTPASGGPDPTYNIRLRLLKIGEVALVGIDGELYSSMGKALREASPMENTILITHESSLLLDNPGYIFDDETVARVGERDDCGLPGFYNYYGTPGTVQPSLNNCLKSLFERLPEE